MELPIIRLLFDTGLFVLIWMIQLVVYPCFVHFEKKALVTWHKRYTKGLSFIVIPLMFGQLIIAIIQMIQIVEIKTMVSLIMVIAVWVSTFIQFVPIHNKIAGNNYSQLDLKRLVNRNWLRTALWTIIFCWSLYSILF